MSKAVTNARRTRLVRGSRTRRGRSGTTFVELVVVMAIMVVAVSIFYRMVVATAKLRDTNHENAVAAEAARIVVERMRNEELPDVWRIYNQDPLDDPNGEGTAYGHRFEVKGLKPQAKSPDGMVGQVFLASILAASEEAGGAGVGGSGPQLGGGGGLVSGGGGLAPAPAEPEWQLREDLVLPELGLPRDLSGDSIIDDRDHSEDYIILPVRVLIEWQGRNGPRSFEIHTMLTKFKTD